MLRLMGIGQCMPVSLNLRKLWLHPGSLRRWLLGIANTGLVQETVSSHGQEHAGDCWSDLTAQHCSWHRSCYQEKCSHRNYCHMLKNTQCLVKGHHQSEAISSGFQTYFIFLFNLTSILNYIGLNTPQFP